jgi:hypothetical protein
VTKARTKYLAYLLRLWCEDDELAWRATLESARTGERHGFANLAALAAFLSELTEAAGPAGSQPPDPAQDVSHPRDPDLT